jgi:predicted SnoaL-like aldol condensation-catalyzing enzyme
MQSKTTAPKLERKKDRTAAIQQSLLNGGTLYPLSFFDSRKYIQHNVKVEDGLGAIYAYMDALPKDRRSVRTHRALEDGDYSFTHNDYRLGELGAIAAFEVLRWENDRIVEHWDNLQSLAAEPNPSGRTMTDGATAVTDLEKTAANKALVERYTDRVLIRRDPGALSDFFGGDQLLQHNPVLGDGVAALRESLQDNGASYKKLHKLLGEGNFVLAMSEGLSVDRQGTQQPTAFFDLYRIAHGVIAEHWDVIEVIPPREEWVNENGKF